MLFWTLKWVIISLTMISLIHYIYNFMLERLTVRKVRDVQYDYNSHYQEMINSSIQNMTANESQSDSQSDSQSLQQTDVELPNKNISMKDELKSFLNSYSSNNGVTKLEDL